MISLPKLTIERDELQEASLLVEARQWLDKADRLREAGIHASDLLDPLYAYWQWANPQELSERQVWLFLIGRVLHHFVLEVAQPEAQVTSSATDSGTHHELGILYSPDIIRTGRPIELKTNRAFQEPTTERIQEEWTIYWEQLCIYLVLTNNLVGYLWVLFINLKDDTGRRTYPEPRCYRVVLTEEQFFALETSIIQERDVLIKAKEERTPNILPLCRTWKCGDDRCPHWTLCKPEGRWPQKDRRKWVA